MTRGTRFFPYSGPIAMVNERRGVALLNSVSMTQWFSAHVFVDARVKPALNVGAGGVTPSDMAKVSTRDREMGWAAWTPELGSGQMA